ncbi:(2Fe-2S)-binding protein [Neptunomonas sp. XY-337]|uniref:(2Fe-2S)-binding protein n=1 Tax=Neptunomonas sp. XY-337 TaxID=2561897 RepID=UPI0010AA1A8E|nr:(2Fe-2S)-binding protein [Neptunomonas sp. XY-337]
MAADSSYKRVVHQTTPTVQLTIEGQTVEAFVGESVAAAVLQTDIRQTRTTPVSDSGRAPYCMMGVCFECLMEIDGVPNTQACMTEVREGMVVNIQRGSRSVSGESI